MIKRVLFILCLLSLNVCADPSVNSVSGTVEHGGVISISGSDFGVKSPAAPLMWDDGEGRTLNSPDALASHGWDHVNQVTYSVPTRPQYNLDGYRNVESVHVQSLRHITLGHDYSTNPGNPANTMDLGMDAGSATAQWVMFCYYRLDPLWPAYESSANLKDIWLGSTGFDESDDPHNYFFQADGKLTGAAQIGFGVLQGNSNPACDVLWWEGNPYNDVGNNPENGWVKYEYIIGTDIGVEKWSVDNHPVYGYDEADCIGGRGNTRYFSIGSYYRKNAALETDDDAFRHYDDMYLDNTLSRVILTDNQDYDQATIIEPQIPSVWSDGSITATMNLGGLTGDTVYLFVFDADNSHNIVGYPVSSGPASTCASQGYYCCPSGNTCSATRSGSGCVGTCCASSSNCTLTPTCGDSNCDSGETCASDNCCDGVTYNASSEVCCSDVVYAGDCCSISDCSGIDSCVNYNCQTLSTDYSCGIPCSTGDGCTNNILADSCVPSGSCDGTNDIEDIILPNSTLQAGFSYEVQVEYECYLGGSGDDQVSIWYYNGSSWAELESWMESELSGCDAVNDGADGTVSTMFVPDDIPGTHYIRAIESGAGGITDTCPTLAWGDIDDLAFSVISGGCAHEADSDCLNGISLLEITSYIGEWSIGDVSIGDVLDAVNIWRFG